MDGGLSDLLSELQDAAPHDAPKRELPRCVFEPPFLFSWDLFRKRLTQGYLIEDKHSSTLQKFGPLLAGHKIQAQVLVNLLDGLKEGGPQRRLILKNRRAGVSTLLEIVGIELALQIPNWTSAVIAHTETSSARLLQIARTAIENLPVGLGRSIHKNSEERIVFGNRKAEDRAVQNFGHVATFKSETAGGKYPLAGDQVRYLHLSECAKYDAVGDVTAQRSFILNAMGAVPKSGPSMVCAETTANGQQGWFYETWMESSEAIARRRRHEWKLIFIPWYKDASCAMPVPQDYQWDEWMKDDREHEDYLVKKYNLSKEQLFFRRYIIGSDAGMNPDFFDQEYPDSPRTAFIASGRPVFQRNAIKALERGTSDQFTTYDVRVTDAYAGGMNVTVED